MFDSVWITNNLLAIWLHDVNNLKDVQHHVVDRDIELSDELKKLSFDVQPWVTDDFKGNNEADAIHLRIAQENDAFIIADSPVGKIIEQSVPDDWYDSQVYPEELYAALEALKMPHPSFNAEKVRSGIVEQLLGKPRIVLENHALIDLLEADALETCFSYFSVFIVENIVYGIHFRAQEHFNRRRQAEWLENGYNAISILLKQKKVGICPIPQSRLTDMPQSGIYLNMLIDEFLRVFTNI